MAVSADKTASAEMQCADAGKMLDVRGDFPILSTKVHGHRLVYLDNAATTQKPQAVIDAIVRYYSEQNANVHRGVHHLSQKATDLFEEGREKVRRFINAAVPCEVVFTRGATEAINLVAHSYGRQHIGPGDEVLISHMEHHSNILPWQLLCQEVGAQLKVIPVDDHGDLILEEFDALLTERTKMVAVAHVSNALGTVNPVRAMVDKAHALGGSGVGGRRSEHTASEGGRAGAWVRFLCFLRPQDVWSHGDRRALTPGPGSWRRWRPIRAAGI